jgi:hypothetical protein
LVAIRDVRRINDCGESRDEKSEWRLRREEWAAAASGLEKPAEEF